MLSELHVPLVVTAQHAIWHPVRRGSKSRADERFPQTISIFLTELVCVHVCTQITICKTVTRVSRPARVSLWTRLTKLLLQRETTYLTCIHQARLVATASLQKGTLQRQVVEHRVHLRAVSRRLQALLPEGAGAHEALGLVSGLWRSRWLRQQLHQRLQAAPSSAAGWCGRRDGAERKAHGGTKPLRSWQE